MMYETILAYELVRQRIEERHNAAGRSRLACRADGERVPARRAIGALRRAAGDALVRLGRRVAGGGLPQAGGYGRYGA